MPPIKAASNVTSQYTACLSQRNLNIDNPFFFIDVAEFFFPFNRTLALQILSNIAWTLNWNIHSSLMASLPTSNSMQHSLTAYFY